MICPHCNHEFEIPDNVIRNMDVYQQRSHVVTDCCGKIVRLTPRTTFTVSAANPSITVDDWGREST